jgi:hypothetical protein
MRRLPSSFVVWYAVLGGPVAWFGQFIVNLFFTWATCAKPYTPRALGLPDHDLEIGISIGALLVGATAFTLSTRMYLLSRPIADVVEQELEGKGAGPPIGRVGFLGMVGMTVNLLAATIIVMTGVAGPLLSICHQA